MKKSGTAKFSRRKNSNMLGYLLVSLSIIIAAVIFKAPSSSPESSIINQPIVNQFDTIKVPVPVEPVPAGTKIKDIKFQDIAYPAHQVPVGALRDLTAYSEAKTATALPASLPVFSDNLSLNGVTSNPVIEQIPPGMRAMTLRVDATSAVEGWAGSGSIVDVLLVEKERTTVVAEKVKVLSAERSTEPVEGSQTPNVPTTVTLLVSQEQCLAINTALRLGTIAFALRGKQDENRWVSNTFSAERLKGRQLGEAPKGGINGFVIVKEGGKKPEKFALAGDRWVKSTSIPEGFMVAEQK